tara:strand:+ start:16773 stop:17030 length:258 start_codon:yes stop_codon:yes gene_type:complete
MRLFIVPALLSTLLSVPAFADQTSGEIVAYDRLANVIVLADKSIWRLDAKTLVPSDLMAGDKVTLTFTSDGDNGAKPATALTRSE